MREGWEVKLLQEFCTDYKSAIVDGPFGSNLKREHFVEKGVPVLKIQNIKSHNILLKNLSYVTREKANELKRHSFIKNDIVMTKLGDPLGVSGIVENIDYGIIVADLVRIRPNKIDTKFLCYQLNAPKVKSFINSQQKGATRPRVKISTVRELPIAAPPLPEQKRIVAILDEAFEWIGCAVANAEKNLANARDLFESYLNNVFTQKGEGWVEKKLGDLVEVQSGGTPLRAKPEFWGGDIAWYSSGELNLQYTIDPNRKITHEGLKNSNAKLFPIGSLLIGMYDTAALKMSIIDRDAAFNQAIAGAKPNDKIDLQFVLYAINAIKPQILNLRRGVRQKNLSLVKIKNVTIPIPNLTIQRKVVENLSSIKKEITRLEEIYQRKLIALAELKQSILQKAFAGELTESSISTNIIPFPKTIPDISTTDLHAGILAIAYQQHKSDPKHLGTFGHVKAEKIVHMVEAHVGINLGRNPFKDAAGPNDFPHLKKVEHRARKASFFDFKRTGGEKYSVTKKNQFNHIVEKTRKALGEDYVAVKEILELFLPMETKQAEIFATVYAAWNNLLIRNEDVSDEAIVFEARENWHKAKLKIPRTKFFIAIGWMRKNNVVPRGDGYLVEKKASK